MEVNETMEVNVASPPRRVPQRARGEQRVSELLEAAAAEITEAGYEATTMKAIAERAGASIGAVYQYFPNKEAIVQALRSQYVSEMDQRWIEFTEAAEGISISEMGDRITTVIIDYIETRPAFIPLLSVPLKYERDPASRNRLREQFAALFRKKKPSLTPREALRIANVSLHIVKAMRSLLSEAPVEERQEIVGEFRLVLSSYLVSRLMARS